VESLEGRQAARRQDHHPRRDRFHLELRGAPGAVADRLVQYARVVGPENVIGGVDCGFGTFAGRLQVDSKIVWMKLASLAEGAQLASRQLW
jgi:methionine synthase II (cobalamin-independent)